MTSELEQEIDQTREHLAATVDALTAKAETGRRRATVVAGISAAAVVGLLLWRRFG
ncbi:hypothetical protein C6I20_15410 [Aeromicrobium sp. A1-2]|uniref:DUF3618 domain-containing protein n=1 Tax=Aeromicrobium sp. A1-2 TaxID=2107713 RepID=UPI000E502E36|nr:DUF3618 domain-containing protein [Aeromicrobium sp. A1-2]AXT86425.1 hypothetical protein C6I20_15410 [Aeromicrobium sp. A1-2]